MIKLDAIIIFIRLLRLLCCDTLCSMHFYCLLSPCSTYQHIFCPVSLFKLVKEQVIYLDSQWSPCLFKMKYSSQKTTTLIPILKNSLQKKDYKDVLDICSEIELLVSCILSLLTRNMALLSQKFNFSNFLLIRLRKTNLTPTWKEEWITFSVVTCPPIWLQVWKYWSHPF